MAKSLLSRFKKVLGSVLNRVTHKFLFQCFIELGKAVKIM